LAWIAFANMLSPRSPLFWVWLYDFYSYRPIHRSNDPLVIPIITKCD
jgi:hypothetical protein